MDFLRLYAITDRSVLPEGGLLKAVEETLRGGVGAVQLREKDLSPEALLKLARKIKTITTQYSARLFINQRAEIADAAGAEGVHLTENSIGAKEVRRQFPHLLIGVSTHSLDSAIKVEGEGADFITFGPVYETPSKKKFGPPQGLDRLEEVTREVQLPVLALGGINRERIRSVMDRGAFGAAMISGIWNAPDIKTQTFEYLQLLRRNKTS